MKLFMPKQHGAWAMLIIPFWLGVVSSGFVLEHIPFFFGWVLLYLGTYPLLLLFKRKKMQFHTQWALIYLIPAILLLLFPLFKSPGIVYFGLMMIPFFIVNAFFSAQNKDRALMNDFSAIITFSMAGLASSYLSVGKVMEEAVFVFIISILFFIGSTFFVKTMIREKKNIHFKWITWMYHILVPIAFLFLGYWLPALALLPSLGRAIGFYGKTMATKQIGIFEIINSTFLFIMSTVYFLIL